MDLRVYWMNVPPEIGASFLYARLSGVNLRLYGDWIPVRIIRFINNNDTTREEGNDSPSAIQDLKCITSCDIMLLFTFSTSASSDIYMKAGAALAAGKRVVFISSTSVRENKDVLLNHPRLQFRAYAGSIDSTMESLNRFAEFIINVLKEGI